MSFLIEKMTNLLVLLFLVLLPFYQFESGVPQLSHVLFMGLFACIVVKHQRVLRDCIVDSPYPLYFLIYATVVNVIYFIIYNKYHFLWNTSYFMFNVMVYFTFVALTRVNRNTYQMLLLGLICSAAMQFVLMMFGFGEWKNDRLLLFCNNPNQLGSILLGFSTLFFVMISYPQTRIDISNKWISIFIVFIIMGVIITINSGSKAAIFSFLYLLSLIVYFSSCNSIGRIKAVLLSVFVLMVGGYLLVNYDMRISGMMDEKDSSLGGRGYDRIYYHPMYLLFGAGEGFYDRFQSLHQGEIHSSLANILFSYGVIGFGLFSMIIRRHFWHNVICMSPLLMYSLTHNSIRSPLVWIALAIILSLKSKEGQCTRSPKD